MLQQKILLYEPAFFFHSPPLPLRQFVRDFVLLFFGDCTFLCSLFSPHYVSLSALPLSVLLFDCLLPSVSAAFPPTLPFAVNQR